MNKFTFIASVCAALFFAACGDDSSPAKPSLENSSSSSSAKSSSSKKVEQSSSSVILSSSSAMLGLVDPSTVVIDFLTDSRDGQIYKTVTIGSQTWMAQNLNYETADSYCHSDTPSNCIKYGRLYTWAAAISACPSGWHLPTKAEFDTLISVVGYFLAGKKLKSTSGWISSGNGTDDYSFSALPAGARASDASFGYEGYRAYFWSSTEYSSGNYRAYAMYWYYFYDEAYVFDHRKDFGFSIRCLQD